MSVSAHGGARALATDFPSHLLVRDLDKLVFFMDLFVYSFSMIIGITEIMIMACKKLTVSCSPHLLSRHARLTLGSYKKTVDQASTTTPGMYCSSHVRSLEVVHVLGAVLEETPFNMAARVMLS